MSVAIRIDEEIYSAAQKVSKAEFRSVSEQISFWAMVGKTALDNPDLPVDFIQDILISKNMDSSLAEPFHFTVEKS